MFSSKFGGFIFTKIRLAAWSFLLFTCSFVNVDAAQCPFSSGCFQILSDGTVVFKINYSGSESCPTQYLWINNGGTTIGPIAADPILPTQDIYGTHYYFLPPGTLTSPLQSCYYISHDGNPNIATPLTTIRVCQCEGGRECDAGFSIQLDLCGYALMTPYNMNPNWYYDFNYGTGWGNGWVAWEYQTSGTYSVCMRVITDEGEVCQTCMDVCIDVCDSIVSKETGNRNQNQAKENKTQIANILVYPNPADDKARLIFDVVTPSFVTVEVNDAQGKVIKKVWVNENAIGRQDLEINTKELLPGYYLIRINVGNKSQHTRAIIVK